jgi:hypothetical protein
MKEALRLLKQFKRVYFVLSGIYYGLVLCGMIFVVFDRPLQQLLLDSIGQAYSQGTLIEVLNAYVKGKLLQAIGLTFVINLFLASFISINLPSLIIPFSGLLVGSFRALLWGFIFSPPGLVASSGKTLIGVLTVILLLLEGQGYILAMLAAYVQGVTFLNPRLFGASTHRQGYWLGIKHSFNLYLLVVLVLAVAAVYEAAVVILVFPRLL